MNERETEQTSGVKNRENKHNKSAYGWMEGLMEEGCGSRVICFGFLSFFFELWNGKKGESGMEKVITAELPEGSPAAKGI